MPSLSTLLAGLLLASLVAVGVDSCSLSATRKQLSEARSDAAGTRVALAGAVSTVAHLRADASAAEAAIVYRDDLVADITKQKEATDAKLSAALAANRAWADEPVPVSVLDSLRIRADASASR